MVAIIIGPSLSTGGPTGTGLSVVSGLAFGVGLILGFSGFTGIQFNGAGSLTPVTIAAQRNSATLAGAGNLNALLQGPLSGNSITFPGVGGIADPGSNLWIARADAATFAGAGSLTGNAAKFIFASFAGSGNLTPTVGLALQALISFSGAGGKPGF